MDRDYIPFPFGVFQLSRVLSRADFHRIKKELADSLLVWEMGSRKPIILEYGMDFIPLHQEAILDAFCRYCSVANLKSSVWCQGCGAPLTGKG